MVKVFRNRIVMVVAFLALVAGFAGGLRWYAYGQALDQLNQRGQSDLALASDRLTGALQRYRELAVLLADHPAVSVALANPDLAQGGMRQILEVADKSGSLNIVIVDPTGQEILSARGVAPRSHFAEPDFQRAMDGALGLAHRWDDQFDQRVFAFAAPVFSASGPVRGVVIVTVDVEAIEANWRGNSEAVYFTDKLGVVFVANRSELVFLSRSGDVTAAGISPDYPTGRIGPFVRYVQVQRGPHEIWQVDGGRYLPSEALHLVLDLPVIGMTGEALLDVAPARQLADLQALVAAALCLAFGALLFLLMERRRTLAEANQMLEGRVAERTVELQRLNAELRHEVAERAATEAQLKKAQADLVQAGKLSALGQMSAGISHELNQPLMAIRSFAENAEAFLVKGKTDVAAQNLSRISDLARRMGRIIRNLRAFARQESEPIGTVDLNGVVQAALEMASGRMHQSQVTVQWHPGDPVWVRGGEVRLQQVLMNLVTNAADAMTGSAEKRIEIAIDQQSTRVFLTVRDTGPGISEPEKIFDPFYSTKQVSDSEGMGLGLSISYGLVQSFGGDIRGRNHPEGGAVFSVELERAVAP